MLGNDTDSILKCCLYGTNLGQVRSLPRPPLPSVAPTSRPIIMESNRESQCLQKGQQIRIYLACFGFRCAIQNGQKTPYLFKGPLQTLCDHAQIVHLHANRVIQVGKKCLKRLCKSWQCVVEI